MSEKLAEVYAQYDMEIVSTKKGRGSTIIETEDDLRILEPFRGSMARLEQEYVLKQLFLEKGITDLDHIIKNRDGQLFSCDKYRQPFVLKKHFDGRECDMHEKDDIIAAINVMADFHRVGRSVALEFEDRWNEMRRHREEIRVEEIRRAIEDGEEMERISYLYEISRSALEKAIKKENEHKKRNGSDGHTDRDEIVSEDVKDRFARHNTQIRKIGRFVGRVKRRNSFENLFLKVYGGFLNQGVECVSMLSACNENSSSLCKRVLSRHYGICHGSFNQHNVILCDDKTAIVHFERFSRDNQLNDLYQFSRKTMEKNHFDYDLLMCMLDTYSKKIELKEEDYKYLYILFSYPEKFWKIANSYYNSNKAFLSPKYYEKLETVICQEKEKRDMLMKYERCR